jgi:hypothetical protein
MQGFRASQIWILNYVYGSGSGSGLGSNHQYPVSKKVVLTLISTVLCLNNFLIFEYLCICTYSQ